MALVPAAMAYIVYIVLHDLYMTYLHPSVNHLATWQMGRRPSVSKVGRRSSGPGPDDPPGRAVGRAGQEMGGSNRPTCLFFVAAVGSRFLQVFSMTATAPMNGGANPHALEPSVER